MHSVNEIGGCPVGCASSIKNTPSEFMWKVRKRELVNAEAVEAITEPSIFTIRKFIVWLIVVKLPKTFNLYSPGT